MIRNTYNYLKVWLVEQDGNRLRITFSTQRKEFWAKKVDEAEANDVKIFTQAQDASYKAGEKFFYAESNWGKFNYLAGAASDKAQALIAAGEAQGDVTKWGWRKPVTIKVPEGKMEVTSEPYVNNSGDKVYPTNWTIFDFELVDYGDKAPSAPAPDDIDDAEFPF